MDKTKRQQLIIEKEEYSQDSKPMEKFINAEEGEYSVEDMQIALMFMEYTAKEGDEGFNPQWRMSSAVLGVPEKDLKKWWKNREKIHEAAGHSLDLLPTILSTKLKVLSLSAVHEVERRGLESFSNKELITFLKQSISLSRILDNKSTHNIAIGVGYCDQHVKLIK